MGYQSNESELLYWVSYENEKNPYELYLRYISYIFLFVYTDTCECSAVGTLHNICSPMAGLGYICPCKHSHRGTYCDKCSDGYHGYPACTGNFLNIIHLDLSF